MAIVKDYRILKALERRGHITCMDGKVRHWSGIQTRVYYVDYGTNPARNFTYNGKDYELKYFDGCFNPFVVERGKPVPSFV